MKIDINLYNTTYMCTSALYYVYIIYIYIVHLQLYSGKSVSDSYKSCYGAILYYIFYNGPLFACRVCVLTI